MGPLALDIRLPLRSFALELALETDGVLALTGPSGAGKTSVLRAVAGLARASGSIVCGGETWLGPGVDLPAERRSVGLVFQEYALFPHLSVRANVAFGGRARADELLERFRIGHLASVRPGQLSGGERQRVALARALAHEPKVLLLDEPMAALDPHTRGAVRAELQQLLAELALPTLLVTHDFEDASALADRVGVIADGTLRQLAAPADLVASPADSFVAGFAGGNVLHGTARPGASGLTDVELEDGTRVLSTDTASGQVSVVVYPWEISVARDLAPDSSLNHVRAPISSLVPVGNRVRVRVGPLTAEVTAESAERLGLARGELVVASFKAAGTRLLR